MSLKETFEELDCITNPKLEKLILKYFGIYFNEENFHHYVYLFSTDYSVRVSGAITDHLNDIKCIFYNNKEITKSKPNIYLYTVYKLIDKLDKAKINCSKFDDSHFFNIIRLSKVAYDFAISTNKLWRLINEKKLGDGVENNYSILLDYYSPYNDDHISFEKYKNSADEIIKDVDIYHNQIVRWYKKNKKLPSTSTGFGYRTRNRLCNDELWNKVEKTLVELVSTDDEKFLLVEKHTDSEYKKLYFLNRYPCKMISIISFRELTGGCNIYMYLLTEYIAMIDDVIDTSEYTDDDIIELVKEYNSIYESIMKPWLKDNFELKNKLFRLQEQGNDNDKEKELRFLMYPKIKVFFNVFLDKALSKMKN